MKKKIFLMLITIILLLISTDKVEAMAMYMECKYGQSCYNMKATECSNEMSSQDYCWPNINTYIPFTNESGNIEYRILEMGDEIKEYELEDDAGDSGCWLKEYESDYDCENTSQVIKGGPPGIFETGTCPTGIIFQSGFQASRIAYSGLCAGSIGLEGLIPFLGWGVMSWSCDKTFCDFEQGLMNWQFIPYGSNGNEEKISTIDKTEYIFYSFVNSNGVKQTVAEGYTDHGRYCYIGTEGRSSIFKDEIKNYQKSKIVALGTEYWKVHSNFDSLLIATKSSGGLATGVNVCQNGKSDCISNHGYVELLNSNDLSKLEQPIKNWYEENKDRLDIFKDIVELANKNIFVDTCKNLNSTMLEGKTFKFDDTDSNGKKYDQEALIKDLEASYKALELAYSDEVMFPDYGYLEEGKLIGTSMPTSATTWIYVNTLNIKESAQLAEVKDKDGYFLNGNYLVGALKRDVRLKLDELLQKEGQYGVNFIDVSENLNDYTLLFYTTVAYLDANNLIFNLNNNQIARVAKLREDFAKLVEAEELNIYPVVDCESLIGDKLIAKIESYTNIVKIAIPIILIGFGVIDFTKAMFSGDESAMKKAQQSFIKRIAVAVLIFLTPTIVNLLLSLANKVWITISPTSCGIFN